MTQAASVAEQSQADRQEWEDIEDFARELFHVWAGDGDLEWAKTAWQALEQGGLTTYTSEAERTHCIVRLLALSALYREFCVYAFDEGSSGEWQEAIDSDLLGDYPRLDAFTLGQLTERRQIDVDNSSLYESEPPAFTFVIMELVREEYRGVVDVLMEQWGANAFFTSLWVSAGFGQDYDDEDEESSATSPVSGDQISHVTTGKAGRAHSWFKDGLPL